MKRKPPKARACPVCGTEYVPRKIGQKTCSRSCSGKLVGRSHRAGGRPAGAKIRKVCPQCGTTYQTWPSYGWRKYCSATCQGLAARSTPGGCSVAEWRAAKGARCESCGTRRGPFHLHHCIYRQEVRRRKGDQHDPANGMTLCLPCHSGQHSRKRPIPLAKVPAAAVAYAVRLMGEDAAHVYLARRYAAEPTTQEVRSAA